MPNYAIQEQNQDMVSLLSAYFRLLYNPAHSVIDSAMLSVFPGVIGFWPGLNGITSASFALRDMSGSGLHLTASASPPAQETSNTMFGVWANFNGSSNYYYVADAAYNSILGTETSIASAFRGLTFMAWVRPSSAIGTTEEIGAKWLTTGNQRSWRLRRNAAGTMLFSISSDGTAATLSEVTSSNNLEQNEWHFVAARFTPSTEIKIWESASGALNTNTNTTSIPAAIFDSSTDLMIGAVGSNASPGEYWNGNLSRIVLCRAAVPDSFINLYFQMTAPLFGISI